jgi:hypothetical protein
VNLALAAVALAVGAGAVVAVSVRELRVALIGLAAALVGSALLDDPLPSPATLAVRVVGALLAVAILQAALPGEPGDSERDARRGEDQGTRLGWPAESLLAIAAALAGAGISLGLAVTGQGVPGGLPIGFDAVSTGVLATAAAAALVVLGAGPAAFGRSGSRRAIGLVLVAQAVLLLRVGLAGAPGDLEQVAVAGLIVGCAAAGALLGREVDGRTGSTDGGS